MKKIILFILMFHVQLNAQGVFSVDSAAAYLKTLSVDIGPRPMSSPAERKAMEFGIAKFKEFGIANSYLMEMLAVEPEKPAQGMNVRSGVAVGILPGKTERIILIGGHIDSASPEIPGANDDGSGAATVIELARVLSGKEHESTIVFCLFGGEESGLCGSRFFVDNFPLINHVALMLQVDMTNGSETLVPLIDVYSHSAPLWLVAAAFEEFNALGYKGLSYPTHFLTLNNSFPGGGIGSDHQPFLEKHIPAIDFTSDINDPIHTPQDNFENFAVSGLKRSGDLVFNLVNRFDKGVPSETTDNYYLLQIASLPIFFPIWFLYLFIAAAVMVSGVALFVLRNRRSETDRASRPKIPAIKLFLLMLVIQSFVWVPLDLLGLLKGQRFPWFNDSAGYFILAVLSACIGVWVALQAVPTLKLSKDPYRIFLRTFFSLVFLLAVFSLITVKMALYPATALFFLGLAVLFSHPFLKVLFWIISPHFMYRLLFSEGFGLISRSLTGIPGEGFSASILLTVVYVLFFSLWSFPFLTGFASLYRDSNVDLLWLKRYKSRTGILGAGLGFAALAIFLLSQPTFSRLWFQPVHVDQTYNQVTGKGRVTVRSNEYFNGLHVRMENRDTVLSGFGREVTMTELIAKPAWISVERTLSTSAADSGTVFNVRSVFHFKHRPYDLRLTYTTSRGSIQSAWSPLVMNPTEKTIAFRWYSFPETTVVVPLTFRLLRSDSLTETVEATFLEQIVPVRLERDFVNPVQRSVVRLSTLLRSK